MSERILLPNEVQSARAQVLFLLATRGSMTQITIVILNENSKVSYML